MLMHEEGRAAWPSNPLLKQNNGGLRGQGQQAIFVIVFMQNSRGLVLHFFYLFVFISLAVGSCSVCTVFQLCAGIDLCS